MLCKPSTTLPTLLIFSLALTLSTYAAPIASAAVSPLEATDTTQPLLSLPATAVDTILSPVIPVQETQTTSDNDDIVFSSAPKTRYLSASEDITDRERRWEWRTKTGEFKSRAGIKVARGVWEDLIASGGNGENIVVPIHRGKIVIPA